MLTWCKGDVGGCQDVPVLSLELILFSCVAVNKVCKVSFKIKTFILFWDCSFFFSGFTYFGFFQDENLLKADIMCSLPVYSGQTGLLSQAQCVVPFGLGSTHGGHQCVWPRETATSGLFYSGGLWFSLELYFSLNYWSHYWENKKSLENPPTHTDLGSEPPYVNCKLFH